MNIIKLTATTGMVLTNGEAFGTVVYLGKNDNAANWYEITAEEAAKLQEEAEQNNVLFE